MTIKSSYLLIVMCLIPLLPGAMVAPAEAQPNVVHMPDSTEFREALENAIARADENQLADLKREALGSDGHTWMANFSLEGQCFLDDDLSVALELVCRVGWQRNGDPVVLSEIFAEVVRVIDSIGMLTLDKTRRSSSLNKYYESVAGSKVEVTTSRGEINVTFVTAPRRRRRTEDATPVPTLPPAISSSDGTRAAGRRDPVRDVAAAGGRYYALVIGIDTYPPPIKALTTAVHDAEEVAATLRSEFGFEVTLLREGEAKRKTILDYFDSYRNRLTENDNLLIYFAGHGSSDKDADTAYWLPSGAEQYSASGWISADDLLRGVRVQRARHVLVISDSCYAGDIGRDGPAAVKPNHNTGYLDRMMSRRSRTLMASGGDEPVSDKGSDGHSVFAAALLHGLKSLDASSFTAHELFDDYIQAPVQINAHQLPRYNPLRFVGNQVDDDGDFVFTRTVAPAVPHVGP